MAQVSTVDLLDGSAMPQIGLGVRLVDPGRLPALLTRAVALGYRLIDTAQTYGNEEGVGSAILSGAVGRDQVMITTKVANRHQGRSATIDSLDASMRAMNVELIDLVLIHWPMPMVDRFVETWVSLAELRARGRIGAIGVSNFREEHIERLVSETGITPVVNQVELHPRYRQDDLRAFHAERGIVTQAWAPLGQMSGLLEDPVIGTVARAVDRSAAQVVLRWHVQRDTVVVPKSSDPRHLALNLEVFDFELDGDQMAAIGSLDQTRLGPDPRVHAAL